MSSVNTRQLQANYLENFPSVMIIHVSGFPDLFGKVLLISFKFS